MQTLPGAAEATQAEAPDAGAWVAGSHVCVEPPQLLEAAPPSASVSSQGEEAVNAGGEPEPAECAEGAADTDQAAPGAGPSGGSGAGHTDLLDADGCGPQLDPPPLEEVAPPPLSGAAPLPDAPSPDAPAFQGPASDGKNSAGTDSPGHEGAAEQPSSHRPSSESSPMGGDHSASAAPRVRSGAGSLSTERPSANCASPGDSRQAEESADVERASEASSFVGEPGPGLDEGDCTHTFPLHRVSPQSMALGRRGEGAGGRVSPQDGAQLVCEVVLPAAGASLLWVLRGASLALEPGV